MFWNDSLSPLTPRLANDPRPRQDHWWYCCLVLAAMLVRLLAGLGSPHAFADDPDHYRAFAETLARTGIFGRTAQSPSAFRPPLYPWLLAGGVRLDAVLSLASYTAWLHALAGGVTTALTMSIAARMQLGRWIGLAGLATAIDPILVGQSLRFMTESVFTAGLLVLLAFWSRTDGPGFSLISWAWRASSLGFMLGICALLRPSVWLVWGFFLAAPLTADGRTRSHGEPQLRRRVWGLATAIALVVCTPWLVRNWKVLGSPILTTTHGGYTLALGYNEFFHASEVQGGQVWPRASFLAWMAQNDRENLHLSEVERDRWFRRSAWTWIRAHPVDAGRCLVHHLASFWRLWPREQSRWVMLGTAGYTLPLFVLGLVGSWGTGIWSTHWRVLPLSLLAFTAIHAVFWSNLRMRAPVEPVLALLAARGAKMVFDGWQHWRGAAHVKDVS